MSFLLGNRVKRVGLCSNFRVSSFLGAWVCSKEKNLSVDESGLRSTNNKTKKGGGREHCNIVLGSRHIHMQQCIQRSDALTASNPPPACDKTKKSGVGDARAMHKSGEKVYNAAGQNPGSVQGSS